MAWRYMAQNLVTGAWIEMDVPLSDPQVTYALSGPDAITAPLTPELARMEVGGEAVFSEWQTAIYAEEDDELRAACIVVHSSGDDGGGWSLECAGFATYPHGIPYLDAIYSTGIDPLDVVRQLWAHVQAQPDGDLGVVVDSTVSGVKLGKPAVIIKVPKAPDVVAEPAEPYTLSWWELPDCGDEIDQLAQQVPFDYREAHSWRDTTTRTVDHRIRIGYPRLGRRRDDLRFALGENLAVAPKPDRDGDNYANEVFGVGAGEGRKALQVRIPQRDGRLRRCASFTASDVKTVSRLTSRARRELQTRSQVLSIPDLQVRDHPNAELGSFEVGDDIRVQGEVPWVGDLDLWCRITGMTVQPQQGPQNIMTLQLARSDSFTYQPGTQ